MSTAAHQPREGARGHSALAHSQLDIAAQVDAAECAIDAAWAGDCERVGKWEMRVALGNATPEAEQRWDDRADALAAWLLAEWESEQAEPVGQLP